MTQERNKNNRQYPRYAWAGNRISDDDMAALYHLKMQLRRPITSLVAEAVSQYVARNSKSNTEVDP